MDTGRVAPPWGKTAVAAALVAMLFAAPAVAGHGETVGGVQVPLVDIAAARDVIDAGGIEIESTPIDPVSRGETDGLVPPARRDNAVARPQRSETTARLAVASATGYSTAGARDLIVGNSMTGFRSGAWWTEYYAPNGTIKGVWRRTTYSAKWSMDGDTMCFQYPGQGSSCLRFSITGDRALFYRQNGSGGNKEFRLLPGNPKNL